MATFLHLSDPKEYTVHCFRRSSTSMLADSEGDAMEAGNRIQWRGYIDTSKEKKSWDHNFRRNYGKVVLIRTMHDCK